VDIDVKPGILASSGVLPASLGVDMEVVCRVALERGGFECGSR